MFGDDLVEDVFSLEEEMASRSSVSSKTSGGLNPAKLNGKEVSGDLMQLARDNVVLAASRRASRSVADDLTAAHMIIQNRCRVHLRRTELPKVIAKINASTSSTAALPDIPAITIDFKKFVDDLENILGPNNQIPTQKPHFEASAFQSFMTNVDIRLQEEGFKAETIAGVKERLISIQKRFIEYLSDTDAETRIDKLKNMQTQ